MKLASVHDNLFRYAMRHTEVAQAFIRHYLPTELSEQFDLSTLKIHKDTFIDPELQEFFADTLYEANLVDGSRGGFYFLFEHKSFSKRQTVFDLLGYMVRIWQQQAQQKPKYQQLKLKPIVPIVLYLELVEGAGGYRKRTTTSACHLALPFSARGSQDKSSRVKGCCRGSLTRHACVARKREEHLWPV